jgi:hypothetical protein
MLDSYSIETGELPLVVLVIASFITIFVVGILWATRPDSEHKPH